jgi:hypothetical protein
MSIVDDVKNYDTWLRGQCDVVEEGIKKKHKRMAGDAFMFFRATCFRFAMKIGDWLPERGDAPVVDSVGDAHIENWGTWRDAEGRLVWGVNDFDDAVELPYTYDLLRLTTSAFLAPGLQGSEMDRCEAILEGYRRGLKTPAPRFLNDEVPWMLNLAFRPETKPHKFSDLLDKAKKAAPPENVEQVLRAALPGGTVDISFLKWQRGGGSLGRPRYVAAGNWLGGSIVREAKVLVPSSWDYAGHKNSVPNRFKALACGRYRAPDPHMDVSGNLIVRRIAADSSKIDLGAKYARAYGPDLLHAMGVDLASVHLGADANSSAIRRDLARRPEDWLLKAADLARKKVEKDFDTWRSWYRSHTD